MALRPNHSIWEETIPNAISSLSTLVYLRDFSSTCHDGSNNFEWSGTAFSRYHGPLMWKTNYLDFSLTLMSVWPYPRTYRVDCLVSVELKQRGVWIRKISRQAVSVNVRGVVPLTKILPIDDLKYASNGYGPNLEARIIFEFEGLDLALETDDSDSDGEESDADGESDNDGEKGEETNEIKKRKTESEASSPNKKVKSNL